MTLENQDKKSKLIAVIKLAVIVLVIISVPLYLYFTHPEIIREYSDADAIKGVLLSYKKESALIYLGLNIFQVICSLPGQIFQLAGGYALGFWLALPLTIIGVFIGCSIAFTVSKKLGHDAIRTLFGGKKVTELLDKLDSEKGIVILFVAYLIPGMPKDLVNYVAGLTDLSLVEWFLICTVGRLPGIFLTALAGHAAGETNYRAAVIALLVMGGISLLGLLVYSTIKKRVSKKNSREE